jgi:type II secretory pathway pseudopilin PulG
MPRRCLRRVIPDADGGFTLIELSLALAGLLLVSSVMMSFFVSVSRADLVHTADDNALEQLRDARQRMSRDVREARRFTAASPLSFSVWVDAGWDEVVGADENITWSVDVAGNLWRSVGDDSRIEARGLSVSESYFSFDSNAPSSITTMRMHLVVIVAAPGDGAPSGSRSLETEITLRNVP